jgi:hypothetical protein
MIVGRNAWLHTSAKTKTAKKDISLPISIKPVRTSLL